MNAEKAAVALRMLADAIVDGQSVPEEPEALLDLHAPNDPEQTNVFQCLLKKYEWAPFRVEDARKEAFQKQISRTRMLALLQALEKEKLVRPIDDLRSRFILERA